MPKYFFDIRDRKGTTRDTQGMEFETLEDAILEARRTLHEIASEDPDPKNSAVSVDIRDGDTSLVTVMASTSIVPSVKNLDTQSGDKNR